LFSNGFRSAFSIVLPRLKLLLLLLPTRNDGQDIGNGGKETGKMWTDLFSVCEHSTEQDRALPHQKST